MNKRLLTFLLVLCLAIGVIPAMPLFAAYDTPTMHQPQTEYEPHEIAYKPYTADYKYIIVAVNFGYEPYKTDYKYTIDVTIFDCTNGQHPLAALTIIINGYTRYVGWYWNLDSVKGYLRARSFNPRTGRFTQPGPFWNIHSMQDCIWSILQAGNLFVYCGNDPVNRIDPSGLAFFIIHCDDFGNQANWMADRLAGDLPVYTFGINNTADFINKWNTLIYNYTNPIHGIFVFSHGFNHGIWFSPSDIGISMDGRNRHNTADIHSVAELNVLRLYGALYLFACNVDHLDSYFRSGTVSGRTGGNFAAALSTRVTGYGVVRAFDGAVSFGARGVSPISTRITGNYRPRLASSLTGGQNGFVWLKDRYGQLGLDSQRSPRGIQQYRDGVLNNTFHPHQTFIR